MTSTVYNYAPGPATLPAPVREQVCAELAEGRPVSVLEMGHRTAWFDDIAARSQANLRALLEVPNDYAVLFLPGGARAQYAAVPLNLVGNLAGGADYFDTGYWSRCAIEEAARYARVRVVASVAKRDDGLQSLPPSDQWDVTPRPSYRHYVANETLTGFEFFADRVIDDGSLVADVTSNFLTAPIDVVRHRLIYAAAQKNAGVAGVAIVIVARDALGGARDETPSLYNYGLQDKMDSRFNTPPVFAWYVCDLVLEWTRREGGVAEMHRRSLQRSSLLYECIDQSAIYENPVAPCHRSRTNVFFHVQPRDLEDRFLQEAEAQGFLGLRGHPDRRNSRTRIALLYAAILPQTPSNTLGQAPDMMQQFIEQPINSKDCIRPETSYDGMLSESALRSGPFLEIAHEVGQCNSALQWHAVV